MSINENNINKKPIKKRKSLKNTNIEIQKNEELKEPEKEPEKDTVETLAIKIAKYLELNHENVTFQDKIRQLKTVLLLSVKNKDLKTTKIMLANNVDANIIDYDGLTPLITAIINHDTEMTRLLLEYHADTNVSDNDGWTPLMIAIANNENTVNNIPQDNTEIIKMLLERNADINKSNDDGYTPMIICAMNGEMDIMKMLVDKGANVNEKDNENISVFAHAVMFAGRDSKNEYGGTLKNEMLDFLINKGVDVHVSNINNQSALFLAAHNGYLDMVKYCVEKGINFRQRDVNGVNPMEQAHSRGHKLITSYLANKFVS